MNELAHWEHWKVPGTTRYNAHSHFNGHVQFSSNQGWENLQECLNAIERTSGSRKSTLVEWKDRVKSPRRRK